MAEWGETTIKVKRAILLTEKFMVSHIVDITGIKYQSVETVIQRLLKKGTLVKVDSGQSVSKKGRPKQYYTFASAEEANSLRKSLNALLQEQSLTAPPKREPENPHYVKALSIIRTLESSPEKTTEELLSDIENNLLISQEYEEMVDENNEIVFAYNDFALAKLEILKKNPGKAERILKKARNVFKKYNMQEEHLVDEYFISSQLSTVVRETKRAVQSDKFELLASKLKSFSSEFSSCAIMPSIDAQLGELLNINSQLSLNASDLVKKNRQLEEENLSLCEDKEKMAIHHQLVMEINSNLSESLKNFPESQEIYCQQKLTASTVTDKDEDTALPENVMNLFDRKAAQKRRTA